MFAPWSLAPLARAGPLDSLLPRPGQGPLDASLRLARQGPLDSTERLSQVASQLATRQRELVITTVGFPGARRSTKRNNAAAQPGSSADESQLIFLKQWLGSLGARAANALLIGADEWTCALALAASVPCFTDGLVDTTALMQNRKRKRKSGVAAINKFGRQVVLKWWYALTLTQAGYDICFSDADVAWLQDPLSPLAWDRSFDVQGLSDVRLSADRPNLTSSLLPFHELTCRSAWMDVAYGHANRDMYPCQSAGIFYARATPPTVALMRGVLAMVQSKPIMWDQYAFQKLVMRTVTGLGDELAPLRYQLLPAARFANLPEYELIVNRTKGPLTALEATATGFGKRVPSRAVLSGLVAVHCGYVSGGEAKLAGMRRHGLLQPGLDAFAFAAASAAAASERDPPPTPEVVVHELDGVETLQALAVRFGVPPDELVRFNGLDNASMQALHSRQQLRIPPRRPADALATTAPAATWVPPGPPDDCWKPDAPWMDPSGPSRPSSCLPRAQPAPPPPPPSPPMPSHGVGGGMRSTARGEASLLLQRARQTAAMSSRAAVLEVAAAVATAPPNGRELILGTVQLPTHNATATALHLRMLRAWYGHLLRAGRAANVLLVGADRATCRAALAVSMPCFADRAAPAVLLPDVSRLLRRQRQTFLVRGAAASRLSNIWARPVALKWWYAAILTQAGYHIVFSDADVAWLQDPLSPLAWDRSFDVQGLSDVRLSADRPNLTSSLLPFHESGCRHGWRDYMLTTWAGSVGNGITPHTCASSAIFYARASSRAAVAMVRDVWSYWVARHEGEAVPCDRWNAKVKTADGRCRAAPANDWEERAFNMMLLRHAVGLGGEIAPLRQRVLPVRRFVDAEALPLLGPAWTPPQGGQGGSPTRRVAGAAPSEAAGPVAVHCGSASGDEEKLALLARNGLLKPGLAAYRRFANRTKSLRAVLK